MYTYIYTRQAGLLHVEFRTHYGVTKMILHTQILHVQMILENPW